MSSEHINFLLAVYEVLKLTGAPFRKAALALHQAFGKGKPQEINVLADLHTEFDTMLVKNVTAQKAILRKLKGKVEVLSRENTLKNFKDNPVLFKEYQENKQREAKFLQQQNYSQKCVDKSSIRQKPLKNSFEVNFNISFFA